MNLQMMEIPSGVISMRDDRINKKWNVSIQKFYLAQHAVTQSEYVAITGENPSIFKSKNKPVENVSWHDAIKFCNRLSQKEGLQNYYDPIAQNEDVSINTNGDGYRLPTEAEWEYACRAGANAPRYGALEDIAWFKDNSENQTHETGQKHPNVWGLYDMLGNVWEWCWDKYDEEVYGSYRVFRGGGWADSERGCLATNRRRSHPTFKIDDLGFRIAKSIGS